MTRKAKLITRQPVSAKNTNTTQLTLTGFPITLKKDLMELADEDCSSLTETVKHFLRECVNRRRELELLHKGGKVISSPA